MIGMRFEVLERVGESPIFQVTKARDKDSSRVVCVKTIQSAFARDPAFIGAIRKAMQDLTSLVHPNIARLEEVADEDGVPYLVTEFVRGINLKERIRRIAPFTLSVAVDFAIAIGEALQQAHAQGFVHGDVRPHNVIVSPEGAVRVTDFGLAKVYAAAPEAAAAVLGRGVGYQAPELVSGRPASFSADIYAMGVVLFEMLTGSLPYAGDTPISVALKHQNDPVPSPRAVNPGVPRSLEGIVMKALQKNPIDRYRTVSEMLNDLKAVRDALRFGKSLSWSPMEGGIASPADSPPGPNRPLPTPATAALPNTVPEPQPAGAARMSATTTADDRISPYLKGAIYIVMFILLVAGIGLVAFWMATFAKVPEKIFPDLTGKKIEDARRLADQASVRLMVHEEFKENVPPGVVYQVDQQMAGHPIRPGRTINVWVSKGSRMVYVPDLTNVSKDDVENKLKDAGLILGTVDRQYNDKIPFDFVISQNPRARKRVERDLAVNLVISDGPKPQAETPETTPDGTNPGGAAPGQTSAGQTSGGTAGTGPTSGGANGTLNPGESANPDLAGRENEIHSVNLTKRIPRDGLGTRRVRIDYDDAQGTHHVVDESHGEGDVVSMKVDVYGPKVTVRVMYGDDDKPVSERTMTFKKP